MNLQRVIFFALDTVLRNFQNVREYFYPISNELGKVNKLFEAKKAILDLYLTHNTQRVSLWTFLQTKWDPTIIVADYLSRREYIRGYSDPRSSTAWYLRTDTTSPPSGTPTLVLRTDAEIQSEPSFIVYYSGTTLNAEQVKQVEADVNTIRPAGRTFQMIDLNTL